MKTAILGILTMCLLIGCVPLPWKAWRYEHTTEFRGYPSPWNMPSKETFASKYVDGAFLQVRVMAHDETTNSGSSPYRIIINVLTDKEDHVSVTFHSVTFDSSLGIKHDFIPIEVNRLAEKTRTLDMPVHRQLESYADSVYNPTDSVKGFNKTSLWSDDNLDFYPNKNEKIKVILEVEVHGKVSSERKIIEYEFHPKKESGTFQHVSA